MRVHNKIGSKERLFEMFQKVNKITINESTEEKKVISIKDVGSDSGIDFTERVVFPNPYEGDAGIVLNNEKDFDSWREVFIDKFGDEGELIKGLDIDWAWGVKGNEAYDKFVKDYTENKAKALQDMGTTESAKPLKENNQEIYDELEMRYSPSLQGVPSNEFSEIADMYGVDEETVLEIYGEVLGDMGNRKDEELMDMINDMFDEHDLDFEKLPTISAQELYRILDELFDMSGYSEADVIKIYDKLTKDPAQLKLFNESFDNPEVKDEKYLDKTGDEDAEEEQPNKYDDGVRYPAIKDLKLKDDSLDGLKGDDLPFKGFKNEAVDINSENGNFTSGAEVGETQQEFNESINEEDDQDIANLDEPINVGVTDPDPNDGGDGIELGEGKKSLAENDLDSLSDDELVAALGWGQYANEVTKDELEKQLQYWKNPPSDVKASDKDIEYFKKAIDIIAKKRGFDLNENLDEISWSGVKNVGKHIGKSISGAISNAINAVGDKIDQVTNDIIVQYQRGARNKTVDQLENLANKFGQEFGEMLAKINERARKAGDPPIDTKSIVQSIANGIYYTAEKGEQSVSLGKYKSESIEEDEKIVGGLADGEEPNEFDPQQILKGMEVEMEHTNDPSIALEIAMDHLKEIPDYYDHLEKMEQEADVEGDMENNAATNIEQDLDVDDVDHIDDNDDDLMIDSFKPRKLGEVYPYDQEKEYFAKDEMRTELENLTFTYDKKGNYIPDGYEDKRVGIRKVEQPMGSDNVKYLVVKLDNNGELDEILETKDKWEDAVKTVYDLIA